MIDRRHSLTDVAWTPELASLLADCSAAIARLDARISASSLREAWTVRASISGFAAALRAQHIELEEIDVFCAHFGLKTERKVNSLDLGSIDRLPGWIEASGCKSEAIGCPNDRHWNENLPFIFDPPTNWDPAPQLVRALEVIATWSRNKRTMDCWLALPELLQRMNITTNPLPCLAGGDPALRHMPVDRDANLRRSLKRLKRAAKDGESMLADLEALTKTMVQAISAEARPKSLKALANMLLQQPAIIPKGVSEQLGITLSGAGKLLTRADQFGFVVPLRGVASWKAYVSRDMAVRLGVIKPIRGRPPIDPLPQLHVDVILSQFDSEMTEIDQKLSRLRIY